jgi:hypothetical protein
MPCCTRNFVLVCDQAGAPCLLPVPKSMTETGSRARPTRGNRGVLVTHHAFRPLRMWPRFSGDLLTHFRYKVPRG